MKKSGRYLISRITNEEKNHLKRVTLTQQTQISGNPDIKTKKNDYEDDKQEHPVL